MSDGRQPLLHELVVTLTAPTVLLAGPDGDVDAAAPGGGVQGLFHADVRAVDLFRVSLRPLDGAPDGGWERPEPLLAVAAGPGRSRFVALARGLGDRIPDPTVRLERDRTVTAGRFEERLTVRSSATAPVRCAVRVEVTGDLVPLEHTKAGLGPAAPVPASPAGDGLAWAAGAVRVAVAAPGAVADAARGTLVWELVVPPDDAVTVSVVVAVEDRSAVVGPAPAASGWPRPDVRADDRRLPALLAQSLDDLESLRMVATGRPDDVFVAAGAPWFFTLFGRDSLWAARMMLPLGTGLALGTLRVLAAHQGLRTDPATEEEPGKILHEVRRGVFDDGGGLRLPPVYYGTVDATPLWVCLLHDAWRWGLPAADVEPLLPALVAALDWIGAAADAGGGFLAYLDHTGSGLTNQGWKDSGDAVRFADGTLAAAPVSLAEVQGYAYEAAVGGAALLDAFGLPGGDRWRSFAAGLSARFRERFWTADARGPYPGMALDGAGRLVDAVVSNMGHLLGTGILGAQECDLVADRLAGEDMSGGFGLRTMSALSGGYGSLRYHCGTVWPHDTAVAAVGLARVGRQDVVARLVDGLLAASVGFDGRLPELWGGDPRDSLRAPVPYPAACRPQAWAAASSVALLTAVLGLAADVPAGRIAVRSGGPSPVGALEVRGLQVAGQPLDVAVDREGAVLSVHAAAGLTVLGAPVRA